ncbi:three-Cys-motif partner protein TcmP [Actinoplanes sp. NPDC026619]|uniref:three-Cys-motif partner protein TcmP n=1 Tax=Actinoplanes sp. NPDC026619 TaxID=3155798 RepID=UPI0033E1DB45
MAPKPWGWWTQHKLQILGDYLQAFATASNSLDERIYLDLFAGWPENVSRETNEPILGSVHRALQARPPFTRVCLFEIGSHARDLEDAVRRAYPGRPGIKVYPGDCNVKVSEAFADLRRAGVEWAPTFAFIDQFDSEVRWSTLEQISRFRRVKTKTKAEMWILFATGQYPRGLSLQGKVLNAAYGDSITEMFGNEQWIPIVEGRRRDLLDPAQARAEWVNLMRWRLETALGYQHTYGFTMKNTGGQDLYDMIFATDHFAGDKIMRDIYGTALAQHDVMRRWAVEQRRRVRLERKGQFSLFDAFGDQPNPLNSAPDLSKIKANEVYQPESPHEPYALP